MTAEEGRMVASLEGKGMFVYMYMGFDTLVGTRVKSQWHEICDNSRYNHPCGLQTPISSIGACSYCNFFISETLCHFECRTMSFSGCGFVFAMLSVHGACFLHVHWGYSMGQDTTCFRRPYDCAMIVVRSDEISRPYHT